MDIASDKSRLVTRTWRKRKGQTRTTACVFNVKSVKITRVSSSVSLPCDLCELDAAIPFPRIYRDDIGWLKHRCPYSSLLRNSATSGNFPSAFIRPPSKGLCSMSDHTRAYTTQPLYHTRNGEKLLK